MIRLGSLGGYPFEGPRVLGGFSAPQEAALFAILTRSDPDSQRFEVIYLGHADDLSARGLPFDHPDSSRWIARAGGSGICGSPPTPSQAAHLRIVNASPRLVAIYRPTCNTEQFDRQWKDEWIGSYRAPTTKPLTTPRDAPSG